MHVTNTTKFFFLLINHLVLAYIPPTAILPYYQVHGTSDDGSLGILKWRVHTLGEYEFGLFSRQEGNGGSCDRRAKCKKNKIRDPADNTKCIKCPPQMKPDPTKTLCIQDNDSNKDDKKKQYEEKIKEKIKEKFNQFKEKIKERMPKKKEVKTKEWEEKDKKRQDKRNQKKYRRMAVCSPAVAASIGTVAMLELADGGFSEDLFDSINGDMLEFWPGNDIDDEWLDKNVPDDESDITNEDYVKEFLVLGDAASGNAKRSVPVAQVSPSTHTTQVTPSNDSHPPEVEKKNIVSAIVRAFATLVRALVNAATRRIGTGVVARVSKFFSDGKKPNIKKPGESKLTRVEQKDKAKEIAQNKNWKQCLRGNKPEK